MKRTSFVLVLAVLSASVFAQSNKEDVDILQAAFGKQKKEIVQVYMSIPEDKKAGFWTLYDQYENDRKALGRERISLIEDYANAYETLDDKKSSELMNRKFKWIDGYSKMQKKYFDSMSKLIGGKQASKFFQLEDYLENMIRLEIQEAIPFVDELDKSKLQAPVKQ